MILRGTRKKKKEKKENENRSWPEYRAEFQPTSLFFFFFLFFFAKGFSTEIPFSSFTLSSRIVICCAVARWRDVPRKVKITRLGSQESSRGRVSLLSRNAENRRNENVIATARATLAETCPVTFEIRTSRLTSHILGKLMKPANEGHGSMLDSRDRLGDNSFW